MITECAAPRGRRARGLRPAAGVLALLVLAGCRQDMQDQPKYTADAASSFFADGRADLAVALIDSVVIVVGFRIDHEHDLALVAAKVHHLPVDVLHLEAERRAHLRSLRGARAA